MDILIAGARPRRLFNPSVGQEPHHLYEYVAPVFGHGPNEGESTREQIQWSAVRGGAGKLPVRSASTAASGDGGIDRGKSQSSPAARAAVVRDTNRSFDMGVLAEDLVKETLTAFLESSNGLGWSEKQGSLETFLGGVLLNKARTHFRRDKKVAGSLDDENHSFPTRDGRPTPEDEFESNEFVEKLYEAVGDDTDLRDLITAVDLTTGAHNVNQELADAMGKMPREVVNLKRRLMKNRRVLELLNIYGKGQAV